MLWSRGRQCCAVCSLAARPKTDCAYAVTSDAKGWVGVMSAAAQAEQTSLWGPPREMNERNANAAKYQVCLYRSMYACVPVGV